jgi:hypothetical protein
VFEGTSDPPSLSALVPVSFVDLDSKPVISKVDLHVLRPVNLDLPVSHSSSPGLNSNLISSVFKPDLPVSSPDLPVSSSDMPIKSLDLLVSCCPSPDVMEIPDLGFVVCPFNLGISADLRKNGPDVKPEVQLAEVNGSTDNTVPGPFDIIPDEAFDEFVPSVHDCELSNSDDGTVSEDE